MTADRPMCDAISPNFPRRSDRDRIVRQPHAMRCGSCDAQGNKDRSTTDRADGHGKAWKPRKNLKPRTSANKNNNSESHRSVICSLKAHCTQTFAGVLPRARYSLRDSASKCIGLRFALSAAFRRSQRAISVSAFDIFDVALI